MNERVKFIASYLEYEGAFSELCDEYGVSRKTGYKWIERYELGGASALCERSRAPLSHPHAVPQDVVREILRVRAKHPRWGPRKLLVILRRQDPRMILPAASTVGDILNRKGLVQKRRRRIRSSPYQNSLRSYEAPNSVWCADFKGAFNVNGERCHPLTISDGHSRYLLCCKALRRPLFYHTKKAFEPVFREYGLPDTIRTDNGPPFSTLAIAGLSRLSVWWIRLGIRPERIMPGRPEQNGRHERMHSTLKAETAKPPRKSFRSQQAAFDYFREEYNNERPHEAINQDVPASIYKASNRPYPSRTPHPSYPSHFKVVRSYPNAVISFRSTQWCLSHCLANQHIGLEQVNNDCWKAYFGPIELGLLNLRIPLKRRNRHFGFLVPTERGRWHSREGA